MYTGLTFYWTTLKVDMGQQL